MPHLSFFAVVCQSLGNLPEEVIIARRIKKKKYIYIRAFILSVNRSKVNLWTEGEVKIILACFHSFLTSITFPDLWPPGSPADILMIHKGKTVAAMKTKNCSNFPL